MYYEIINQAPRVVYWPEFPVSFRFGDTLPTIAETSAPGLGSAIVNDAGRSFSGNTQNLYLTFTEAVTISATGWSVTVNGVAKTLTYVSGSGTANVVFQMNIIAHDADVIRLSYDTVAGNTVSVTGSLEIKKVDASQISVNLSRRIHFPLCDRLDALVANEAVKVAVLEYAADTVTEVYTQGPTGAQGPAAVWMSQANRATVTTDASGILDMEYTGQARGGAYVFVCVRRTNGEDLYVRDVVV